jgi:hypothetical protein
MKPMLKLAFAISFAPLLACGRTAPTPTPGVVAPGDSGLPACEAVDPSSVAGIEVAKDDLEGYPPYAIDGCSLVYVTATDGGAGELRLRDLATGSETIIAPATTNPRRPTIYSPVIAWEATNGGKTLIYVRLTYDHSGSETGILGPDFDHAREPRAASDAVVFTGFHSADDLGDSDVYLYDVAAAQLTLIAGGPGQQRFADISPTHIAFTDFAESPGGVFHDNGTDLADIVLYDRASKALTPRPAPGMQAFPAIATPGALAYLDWAAIHPEPKLSQYTLKSAAIGQPPSSDITIANISSYAPYLRPAAKEGVVEWINAPSSAAELWRAPIDLSTQPARIPGLDNLQLFAPSASASVTILATQALTGGPALLRAVPR